MGKPILCVDFDGVVHSYSSGWTGADDIRDPPVPGALEWLYRATDRFDVQIYSSRSKQVGGVAAMLGWMRIHAADELGEGHPLASFVDLTYPIKFCHEKPAAFLTIDDRAVCFDGDWSALDPAKLLEFKPWNKR